MVTVEMTDLHEGRPEPALPSELFVEFANRSRLSSSEPADPARELTRLAGWLAEQSLVTDAASRTRLKPELPAFRALRELIQDVAQRLDDGAPPTRAQVAAINEVMREGLHYHALRADGAGSRFTMTPVGDELDQARSAIAGSLAHYLAEHDRRRLRVCADGTCRWLFVDRSPGGRRRWCDMRTCGNRAKVARHRARQTAGTSPQRDRARRVRRRSGARPS